MKRVMLADDHAPTRADVRQCLEESGRYDVCGEAADAAAAIDLAVAERPDVCLLDVRMPGGGAAAAWEIHARLPETKIVMLTVSDDDDDLFAALRAGASGYLLKDMNPSRLPHAVDDVLEGRAAIPRDLVARLVGEFRDRGPRRRATVSVKTDAELTSREWQVLDLMRNGLTTVEIARRLFLSQTTVRTHIASVVKKLGVADRDAAVRLFGEQ